MSASSLVLWDDAMLAYDWGPTHPMRSVRLELTAALSRDLGLLDRAGARVAAPEPASDELLTTIHDRDYVAAVRRAPDDLVGRLGLRYGIGTSDNPIFDRMHEASALAVGGSVAGAEAVWSGAVEHAVNVGGGLHHAMRGRASGFCVYNDVAIAITRLLDLGARRVAYVDVDVHHGDGVQGAFYADPRVLTISLHQSGTTLFPGTGFPAEIGSGDGEGYAVNVALPPGTDDAGWLRAFHAVVPGMVRAFRPDVLVTQHGADTHAADPLAELLLTVDGQRAAAVALHALAHELTGGRWLALGGGGYALCSVVPRTWTHLTAVVTGDPLDPATPVPDAWRKLALRRTGETPPTVMTDGGIVDWTPWHPTDGEDPIDRAIEATRKAVFPLHGLDPHDPRD